MDPRTSRGYLNNNPGNINKLSGNPWNFEIQDATDPRLSSFQINELTNGRFAVFSIAEGGIAAIPKNLKALQRSGHKTIRQLIYVWAPPTDNNDSARYSRNVAADLRVSEDTVPDLNNYDTAYAMTVAIISVECGGNPYTPQQIESGLRLAGIIKPVAITRSTTLKGNSLTVGGGATTVSTYALQDTIQSTVDAVAPAVGTSPFMTYLFLGLKIAGVLVMLAGAGFVVYEYIQRKKRDAHIEAVPEGDEPPVPAGQGNE